MTEAQGVTIRVEETRDIDEIREITYAAFLNHPVHAPGSLPTEHKIVDCLRSAGALTLSLVAEDHGKVVGHIAFSPALVDGVDLSWHILGPVSVKPDRQNQGIGSALIMEGLRRMKDIGSEGIALVGDPKYYCRFGFKSIPNLTFEGIPAEYFMALSLGGAVPSGEVTHHNAFNVTNDEHDNVV